MKQFIFSCALIFCITNISKAQDSLIMKSGEIISAKVIEINTAEVKYKKFDNLAGPVYSISKSDLTFIKYENGTKEDFSSLMSSTDPLSNMYVNGRRDATEHYTNYKIAGTATFLTTSIPVYGFLLGIAPAVVCASSPPTYENLGYPNEKLMQNQLYANGYKERAKEIKSKKVLKNYISALPLFAVTTLVTIAAALTP
jgi:hypothetical protein